ncbi:MAG TPA: response regulator transcription factor [Thermoleophilaceae bacterium]|nr:response regulator transcription factor [Thermoleophilaceae bacterium]
MIRVLVVDDHPAMRTGLESVLRREPGMVVCALAGDGAAAVDAVSRDPDVALVDYHLADGDGIALCRRLKERDQQLRVLVYSAHASRGLALPARLAGADGVLDKGAPADHLLDAIRSVARGGAVYPQIAPELVRAARSRIALDDMPLLGMLADGASSAEVSAIMRMELAEVEVRVERLLELLKPRIE